MDYRNTKIRIKSPEHSKHVQKLLFKNGFSWMLGGNSIKYVDSKQLYMHDDMSITHSCSIEDIFNQHEFKEVFIEMEVKLSDYKVLDEHSIEMLERIVAQNGCHYMYCNDDKCPLSCENRHDGRYCDGEHDAKQLLKLLKENKMTEIRPNVDGGYVLNDKYKAVLSYGEDYDYNVYCSILKIKCVTRDVTLAEFYVYKDDLEMINKSIACFGLRLVEDEKISKIEELEKTIKLAQKQIDELKKQ